VGFSPWGLVIALAVLAPNLLLLRFPPRDGLPSARVPTVLVWVERVGQALCLVVPVITEPRVPRWWWTLLVAAALAGYYVLWGRYLFGGRRSAELYGPVWQVPVPMAILPVLVFLATAGWLGNVWIAVSALVLATGHIPASVIRARSMSLDR
jgi:hypothetical protein